MTDVGPLYFSSTTASPISPAYNAAWGATSQAVRRKLKTTPAGSGSSGQVAADETSTSVIDVLCGQFSSDQGILPTNPIAGTFDLVMSCRASGSGAADMFQQVRIYVWDSTGTTLRGTLYSGRTETTASATASDPNGEFAFSAKDTRIMVGVPFTGTCTPTATDVLTVEHGARACNTSSTSRTATIDYRDDGVSDATLTAGLTANLRGWITLHLTDPPAAPTGLTIDPTTTTADFDWTASTGSPTGYEIRLNGGAATDVGNVLTYNFTGLLAGTTYNTPGAEVRAYNAGGYSSWASIAFTTDPGTLVTDAVVEIAFDSGYSTPAVDRTWTDVTDYVELSEGVEITYGRQDEFATCDPNTLKLTLDNSDGRFTARRASSPYYPDVKVGRPIRVTATLPGGTPSVRFVGYIDEWPVEWDGTDAYARTQISATSRTARLGSDRELRSIVEEEILADSPAVLYTMGEPEEAVSASDTAGSAAAPLIQAGAGAAVTFGTAIGPGTDGLTSATFSALEAKYLRQDDLGETVGITGAVYLECFFAASAPSDVDISLALLYEGTPNDVRGPELLLTATEEGFPLGRIEAGIEGMTLLTSDAHDLCDGEIHHAVYFYAGTAAELWVDGVMVDSAVESAGEPTTYTGLRVGYAGSVSGSTLTIAHVAAGSTLTGARATAHAEAGLNGFEGDLPGERIERYATLAGVPSAEIDADSGVAPMAHIDTTGQSMMDVLRIVETTEGGVLFDGRTNDLEFRDRASRYLAASSFSLDMANQEVENGVVPKVDRTGLQNDVTATLSDGTVTARIVDQTSVDDYGRRTADVELATTDVNAPADRAAWQVSTYGEPRTRIPALSVDIIPLAASLQDDILAADIGTRFTLEGMPDQAEASTGDFFVEGYTETIGLASHVFTFNISDATTVVDTFVLDSATRGLLDTNVLAY